MREVIRNAALGAVVVGASLFGSTDATAQVSHPYADVMIIHATKCTTKTVDAAIGDPPPSLGYDCLKLLSSKQMPLTLNSPSTTVLPNNRTFQLVHTGMQATDGGSPKYKVTASISNADGSAGFSKLVDVNADPNTKFNVGGWNHQSGVLLLSVKIVP